MVPTFNFRRIRQLLLSLLVTFSVLCFGHIGTADPGLKQETLLLAFEERLILSYFLKGAFQTEEIKNKMAEELIAKAMAAKQQPVETIPVTTFEEFLVKYRGQWPNSYSLDSDLAIIESTVQNKGRVFKSTNPDLQTQIDNYIKDTHVELYRQINLTDKAQSPSLSEQAKLALRAKYIIENPSSPEALGFVKAGFGLAEDLITSKFKEIESVSQKITSLGGGENEGNVGLKRFLGMALNEYFKRFSTDSKKFMLSNFLGEDLRLTQLEIFEVMVSSSGPQFQKLLQLLAREPGIHPDLLKIFRKLENRVRPIPPEVVKELFEKERSSYNWISYDLKPLGTGTMAQVHKGRILVDGSERDVVIRFLKPEIEKRVQEDYRILSEIAPLLDADPQLKKLGFPPIVPLVNDLNLSIREELSLQKTISNQQMAKTAYNKKQRLITEEYKSTVAIEVPNIYITTKNTDLQVQELVTGEKLENVILAWEELIPDLKKALAEAIANAWTEEVLFRSGFYHADLHQGNFLVRFEEPEVKVYLLDYGMAGTIDKEVQGNFKLLSAASLIHADEVIADSLWSLSEKTKNEISKNEFHKLVLAKSKIAKSERTPMSADLWITWAIDSGLRFPYSLMSLNRGIVIINQMLRESGSSKDFSTLASKLSYKYPISSLGQISGQHRLGIFETIKYIFTPPQTKTSAVMSCNSVHLF